MAQEGFTFLLGKENRERLFQMLQDRAVLEYDVMIKNTPRVNDLIIKAVRTVIGEYPGLQQMENNKVPTTVTEIQFINDLVATKAFHEIEILSGLKVMKTNECSSTKDLNNVQKIHQHGNQNQYNIDSRDDQNGDVGSLNTLIMRLDTLLMKMTHTEELEQKAKTSKTSKTSNTSDFEMKVLYIHADSGDRRPELSETQSRYDFTVYFDREQHIRSKFPIFSNHPIDLSSYNHTSLSRSEDHLFQENVLMTNESYDKNSALGSVASYRNVDTTVVTRGMSLGRRLENVTMIAVKNVSLFISPNKLTSGQNDYFDLNGEESQSLLHYPYLWLQIEGLPNIYAGTSDISTRSTVKIKFDKLSSNNVFGYNSNHQTGFASFKPPCDEAFVFESPVSTIQNLRFLLLKPSGLPFQARPETVLIRRIVLNTVDGTIDITVDAALCKDFFNVEHIVNFRDLQFFQRTSWPDIDSSFLNREGDVQALKQFLEKNDGHLIKSVNATNDLLLTFSVRAPTTIDHSDGSRTVQIPGSTRSFVDLSTLLDGTEMLHGIVFNTSIQTTVQLEVMQRKLKNIGNTGTELATGIVESQF